MKKITVLIGSIILHIFGLGIILYAFYPMAKWYFDAKPFWGVDFYYTVTLVNFLKTYPVLPQLGWNNIWFAGWPLLITYPLLHYYLILPLTFFIDLIAAVKFGMLISSLLFFYGSYFCFYQISKSRALAIILSIIGIYSVGTYGAIMWGGSLPNYATQAFYPWTIYFIIRYLQDRNNRYLLISGLLSGLSIIGHPQISIAYILPTSIILIVTTFNKFSIIKKIQTSVVLGILTVLIGLPMLTTTLGSFKNFLQSAVVTDAYKSATSTAANAGINQDIIAFHRNQPWRIIEDTHPLVFILTTISVGLLIFSMVFKKRIFRFLTILPFILLAAYYVGYIVIYSYGISFYHGGWYRLFWSVPFWVGMACCALWGAFYSGIKFSFPKIAVFLIIIIEISTLTGGGYYFLKNTDINLIKENIVKRSAPSSAYPDIVNIRSSNEDRNDLKKILVPDWLPADDQNYRLFSSDQTVNIWWNSFYKMPLSRGYFDPLNHEYFFWLDASLSQDLKDGQDQLVTSFKYPPKVALNNTLYLIDWYGVKYFEAGHASPTVYSPLVKSLTNPEFIMHEEELDFNSDRYTQANQKLHYFAVNDNIVSPILMGSNAATICLVTTDRGFDTINRTFADANLNLKTIIPIKLNNKIDKISDTDLKICQSLILYDYQYQNKIKAFNLISNFIKSGKKIFIDTGLEVKDANAEKLPDIFPITASIRKPLGTTWNFEVQNSQLTQDINFNQFDPPLFDQEEWNFSYPPDSSKIRQQSQIILTNHGKPILISTNINSGQVIWSGMNLPYHVIRSHNEEEVKFFKQIILYLIGEDQQTQPEYQSKFISPQKREIQTTSSSVIFKEMNYQGWKAEIVTQNKKIGTKIYSAGPAYPGFMYVNIPADLRNQKIKVIFTYSGSIVNWIAVIISIIVILSILEQIIFKGRLWGHKLVNLQKVFKRKINMWWDKEDENSS